MSGNPLVSIILPVFNAAPYLEESLNSIICQTYKNLEIIVIDDGSTDESREILKRYAEQDNRIQLFAHEENQGLISTLNEGIERAQGKYIARMDADDVIHHQKFEKQVIFLEKNEKIGMLGTWMKKFGMQEGITTYPTNFEEIQWIMLYHIAFCHASILIKNSVLKEYGLSFDINFLHAEDYDFGIRFMKVSQITSLAEPLYYYRIHQNSVSNKHNVLQEHNTLRIIQRSLLWLSVEASLEQVALFRRFAYRSFDFTTSELEMLEPVLRGLLASPSLPDYSRSQIRQRLWHLALNAHHLTLRQKILFLRRFSQTRLMTLPAFWSQRLLAYHLRRKIS